MIIPTWNGSAYIAECLESIAKQGPDHIEIIVIDDGSTDRTIDIIECTVLEIPIRIVCRQHTGNWVKNTNIGLSIASGRYVSILHQDDVWLPGRLNRIKKIIARHPEVSFIFHSSWFMDTQSRHMGHWACPLPPRGTPISSSRILPKLLIQNFIATSAACFKRCSVDQMGGLDPQLWYTADWKLWIDLVRQGKSYYHPEPLSGFRLHPASLSFKGATQPELLKEQMQAVVDRYLDAATRVCSNDFPVEKLARLSIAVNTTLAGLARGNWPSMKSHGLNRSIFLSPFIWLKYFACSGICSRSWARLKVLMPFFHPKP